MSAVGVYTHGELRMVTWEEFFHRADLLGHGTYSCYQYGCRCPACLCAYVRYEADCWTVRELLESGRCSRPCLTGLDEKCVCWCRGEFHGVLESVVVPGSASSWWERPRPVQRRRCQGVNRFGQSCGQFYVLENGFCEAHQPATCA